MFLFTIVNQGSENKLKEEMSIKYPYLKPSYSRKGFISFKNTDENIKIDEYSKFDLVFVRTYGLCLGKFNLNEINQFLPERKGIKIDAIHKYELNKDNYYGDIAKIGNKILNIIEVSEDEFWLGISIHKKFQYSCPKIEIEKPEVAPSRAYIKLEEAFLITDYQNKENEIALELGSAPGGASYSLLKRGFKVFGVDKAKMNEICLKNPNYTHLDLAVQKLVNENLPENINILLCDINLSPIEIIPQLRRIVKLRPSIKTLFYTLKIGDKILIKDIPEYLNQIKRIGFSYLKAIELSTNHSEIFVYAEKIKNKNYPSKV